MACLQYVFILKDKVFYQTPKESLTQKQYDLAESIVDSDGNLVKETHTSSDQIVLTAFKNNFKDFVNLYIDPRYHNGSYMVFA